jgi:transposase-like protein
VARVAASKRAELESFWRSHLEGWRRSDLNQREYCEAHGLPLKRFGNWRAKLRHEEPALVGKLLYRRGGGLEPMSKHMPKERPPTNVDYVPSGRSVRRRNFSAADKRRIVEEACHEGASVSGVARKYGIGPRLLFAWKRELAAEREAGPTFLPVTLVDGPERPAEPSPLPPAGMPASPPVVVERSTPGIEVDLVGGRRVRFERDTDPDTIRRVVALLEGDAR